ncbi:glycine cleavage system aminomethyltransferase GcvT [Pullulanibacillus sp. KACC 23026]|uniref:glycine cleavage system aminomethyltransferase GcvT n=1 Tax=Pullulanibacillus sp. KACC 23026 TaxID=3028315 RepID=UPI0023B0D639|nr:glycine cleavage system aminomethyltransferase GcvT [Pullulanibacillus sp. KACC 23026]WEG14297.1 glycine cleavage system aminomethyltransferase GcvT [Pullulanibacillus sp. KACC 23026]
MTTLKRTPIYDQVKSLGAKTIDFGGWDLPVQFSSIKEEHKAVRERAGLFDVSHMGEIEVKGTGAEAFLQGLVTNDVLPLQAGDALYTAMCYENGGTVDDLIIYKRDNEDYLLVVNASNTDKDFDWMKEHAPQELSVLNVSSQVAQLAIQGPLAETILQTLTDEDLSAIRFFKFKENVPLAGISSLVSRTGYTGEDGFEIYCPWVDAPKLWEAILEAGQDKGLLPCGLGARDTLRFEAKLPLYGQELSASISPIEGGVGFAVKPNKQADFIGKAVLKDQKENGARRKLVGLEMIDKAIPRTHYEVFVGEKKIGEVTTGTQSPTLGKNLGLALVEVEYAALGTEVEVDVRGKRRKAIIVKAPFYKRG